MISIEDYLEDIVGKAMRGNRISIDQLSSFLMYLKTVLKSY